ncbi:hypothetical protein Q4543_17835 [Salipiger sp. 1_MG-2023]|uniref:hypothetical protein n=1 Tax=Salipiger sp. 1_MG-2023 TaxID=3062665 RepID=UPI0026E3DC96|nr:hypothetical protein [Salipiger sp. 1_MG-2023]MDO6587376.1 hypothetical protein [Salipiger sp. 1_MG-2023]
MKSDAAADLSGAGTLRMRACWDQDRGRQLGGLKGTKLKLENFPIALTDWSRIKPERHEGDEGFRSGVCSILERARAASA